MGLNRLNAFLRRHRRIAFDTPVFICALESNPRYIAFADRALDWLEQPHHAGVTSTLTMTELLVLPYRNGDEVRVNHFFGLLSTFPNLDWVAPDLAIADEAARIRGVHLLKTPDALQAATAVRSHATGFITNDPDFRKVSEFETLLFDELL